MVIYQYNQLPGLMFIVDVLLPNFLPHSLLDIPSAFQIANKSRSLLVSLVYFFIPAF